VGRDSRARLDDTACRVEPDVDFDFAIIGAGVAGWCLAWQLVEGPLRGRRVVVIDGARDDEKLQTLSFWSDRPTFLDGLVRHRWETLTLGGRGTPLHLDHYRYQALFFGDLQDEARRRVLAVSGNAVIEGRLDRLAPGDASVVLTVDGREVRARWAFDSRFSPRGHPVDERRHHRLEQHFRGWVVRCRTSVFEGAAPTFMDFRAAAAPGTAFFYVLPFSAHEALVELVSLAPADAEALRDRYLLDAWRLEPADFEVVDREAGVSLLTEAPFPLEVAPRVRRIGVAAGLLKPSTGYGLTRILEDLDALVASLVEAGHPWGRRRRSWLFSFLDGVLLEVWAHHPELVPAVMVALLEKNPADRVFRFLDERASVLDVLRVGWSLPVTTMAGAALRWLLRRWRGAT
jgi:lycopene beta-cyclase